MHFFVEEFAARLAQRLCPEHRDIGVSQQIFRVVIGSGAERNANTGGGEDFPPLNRKWFRQRVLDALGHAHGVARVTDGSHQDGELVTPKPGQHFVPLVTVSHLLSCDAGKRVFKTQTVGWPLSRINSSPTRCPMVSLNTLKPSMSTNRTANL